MPILERVVARGREQFGEGNWRTGEELLAYGLALEAARGRDEARETLRAAADPLDRNRAGQPRLAARAKAEVAKLSR